MATLVGQENFNETINKGQVYLATHDGVGNRLPYMSRSFISFTFGGKAIEDFNLIATIDDKMENSLYAPFSDITSTYDIIDGQLYWGTRLEANQINFTLSTDGITENQLEEFKYWFSPGVERELVLTEHPNRYIFARVSEKLVFSCLPFEEKKEVKIGGRFYNTSTTLYKGSINLNFIMDEPYWHAKINYMPTYINKITLETLSNNDTDINKVETIKDKDMIKIMLEDGIPHQSILDQNIFLGGNILVTSEAKINIAKIGKTNLGIQTSFSSGLTLDSETSQKLFYSGTAKSLPIIKFSMILKFDQNTGYIIAPKNKIFEENLTEYSYIAINGEKFNFTTSSILTGYNQAIKIFSENTNFNKVDLLQKIRDTINEYYVRAWAIYCINQSTTMISAKNLMKNFFKDDYKVTFIINSKTGESIGIFNIKVKSNNGVEEKTVEQNIGDMIRSNYLVIEGRDYLNENGRIEKCHQISTNEELTDMLIFYENMYL